MTFKQYVDKTMTLRTASIRPDPDSQPGSPANMRHFTQALAIKCDTVSNEQPEKTSASVTTPRIKIMSSSTTRSQFP